MHNLTRDIDFSEFLKRLDPAWPEMVHRGGRVYNHTEAHQRASTRRDWGEAGLLGNGVIGASVYKKTGKGITWELGRNDAEAHNHLVGVDWCIPRIPIGDLMLTCAGRVEHEDMRLHLHDAELKGSIRTERGAVHWRSFVDAVRDVLVIELTSDKGVDPELKLFPAYGVSARMPWVDPEKAEKAGPLPPPPRWIEPSPFADGQLSVQELVDDEGQVSGEVAIGVDRIDSDQAGKEHRIYLVTIQHSRRPEEARDAVKETLSRARALGLDLLRREHRCWWHAYYPKSFLSIPDTRWECFYWMQVYKFAAATRGDQCEVIDNQGPWATDCSWPGTWWNLNVQLSYTSMYKANRLDLARSLLNTLQRYQGAMRDHAKRITDDGIYIGRTSGRLCDRSTMPSREQIMKGRVMLFELGNFTWTLQLIYRHYLSSMDGNILYQLYPLLKSNLNIGLELLTKWDDGLYHLPKTTSPEYPSPKVMKRKMAGLDGDPGPTFRTWHDTTYDLSLVRWGLETLLKISNDLGLEEPLKGKWKEVLDHLAPCNINKNGYMVAKDLPFEFSHRHYSHLFPIYPLHQIDLERDEDRQLAETSIRHWLGTTGALEGYSYTGGACMVASLEDGNGALETLNGLRDYLLPNTMYTEAGGPVIETPLSAVESLHYMFLQCHSDMIHVFPAVPETWEEAGFADLLAEGAFEISGRRRGGVNEWVMVRSLAGSPLVIKPHLDGNVRAHGDREHRVNTVKDGVYSLELKKGESVLLYCGEEVPDLSLPPASSEKDYENYYGSVNN